MMEVLATYKQLSRSEMEIPTKKSSQSKVKPTNDVGVKTFELGEGKSLQDSPDWLRAGSQIGKHADQFPLGQP